MGLRDLDGMTGRQIAELAGHTPVVERLRAVVAEQLRMAEAERGWPEPRSDVEAVQGSQLLEATRVGDAAAIERLLAAGLGLDRIVILYHQSSTSYQIH